MKFEIFGWQVNNVKKIKENISSPIVRSMIGEGTYDPDMGLEGGYCIWEAELVFYILGIKFKRVFVRGESDEDIMPFVWYKKNGDKFPNARNIINNYIYKQSSLNKEDARAKFLWEQ